MRRISSRMTFFNNLSLRRPTVFGDEITFNAPMRFMPFSASPIIKELIDRIDLARRKN
jgi:hypothetical protein